MIRVWNVLLVLVPITLVLEFAHIGGHSAVFVSSALALVPLAAVLGRATEETAVYTGPKIGALLNATLGNVLGPALLLGGVRNGTQFFDAAVLISVGGESNWLEGAEWVALNLMLGIAFYFVP